MRRFATWMALAAGCSLVGPAWAQESQTSQDFTPPQLSQSAEATPPTGIPEPGSVPLVLLGVAGAWAAVRLLNRKK